MTSFTPNYAFTAGELSPELFGRADTDKFGLGLALGKNVYIDYRGGAFSRRGFRFIGEPSSSGSAVRLWPFQFSPEEEDTYVLVFSDEKLEFIQNGGFVLSGASRYSISTPYSASELSGLHFHQRANELIICTTGRRPRKLVRSGHTSWALNFAPRGTSVTAPSNVATAPSSAGTAGASFTVTAVSSDGEESRAATPAIEELSVNYTTSAGEMVVTWDASADAAYYNVYRSLFHTQGAEVTTADELGFLGRAFGPRFVDTNITPDFSVAPPRQDDPLANSAITSIEITAAGTSYAKDDTVSITDPDGSSFEGYPVVNSSGEIVAVVITNGGQGYTSPTVSFSTSTGSGATATANTSTAFPNNNPTCSTVFQQRRIYAGTIAAPTTIYASRVGSYDNYDVSLVVNAADAYSYTLDVAKLSAITDMVSMQAGLLLFTENEVSFLTGQQGEAVSAVSAEVSPASFYGAAAVTPVRIGREVLYVGARGDAVYGLAYDGFRRTFTPSDLSTYSSHLLSPDKAITRWAWAASPNRLVSAVRSDGRLLTFTYRLEEKVFAWTQHATQGFFRDVVSVREDGEDRIYAVVERLIGGSWVRYVERLEFTAPTAPDESFYVDSGLSLNQPTRTGTIRPAAASGEDIGLTITGGTFSASDVGDILRFGNAKAEITAYVSTTSVEIKYIRPLTETLENDMPPFYDTGEWTITTPVSTVSGLDHLEGASVVALADGNVVTDLTVSSGSVTLPFAASAIHVGLSYTARIKTLPINVLGTITDAQRKSIVGVGLRVLRSRNLMVGSTASRLFATRDRSTETYGQETSFSGGVQWVASGGGFAEDVQFIVEQINPLPLGVLGLTFELDVGDPTDA